jgi:hypothetical protein
MGRKAALVVGFGVVAVALIGVSVDALDMSVF